MKKTMAKALSTVNVIEAINGVPNSMRSYKDDKAGNAAAESLFTDLIKANGCPDEDIDARIEDGYYERDEGNYSTVLIHSS
jgi:hypothetical protein